MDLVSLRKKQESVVGCKIPFDYLSGPWFYHHLIPSKSHNFAYFENELSWAYGPTTHYHKVTYSPHPSPELKNRVLKDLIRLGQDHQTQGIHAVRKLPDGTITGVRGDGDDNTKNRGLHDVGSEYCWSSLKNVSYVFMTSTLREYKKMKKQLDAHKKTPGMGYTNYSAAVYTEHAPYFLWELRKFNPAIKVIAINTPGNYLWCTQKEVKNWAIDWRLNGNEEFIEIVALGSTPTKCFYSSSYKQGIVEVPLTHPEKLLDAIAPEAYWREVHSFVNEKGQTDFKRIRKYLMKLTSKAGQCDFAKIRGSGYYLNSKGEIYARSKNMTVGNPGLDVKHSFGENFYLPGMGTRENKYMDSNGLRNIARSFCWNDDFYGDVLFAWCLLAPFSACLEYRPHLWLSGASSAGKSWIIENFVGPLLKSFSSNFTGSSTLHGVLSTIKDTVRPIVHDEFESDLSDSMKEKAKIIEFLRLCSTTNRKCRSGVAKGAVGNLGTIIYSTPSSMALLGSVKSFLDNEVDQNRFLPLVLNKKKKDESFTKYMKELEDTDLDSYMRKHVDILFTHWKEYQRFNKSCFDRLYKAHKDTNHHLLRSCAALWAVLYFVYIEVDIEDWSRFIKEIEAGITTEEERVLTHLMHTDFRLGQNMTSLHSILTDSRERLMHETMEARAFARRQLGYVGAQIVDGHAHLDLSNDYIKYKIMSSYPAKNWKNILKTNKKVDILSKSVVKVLIT